MCRGQVVFDFLVALSALGILFAALVAVAHTQGQQSALHASRLVMERTCEDISQKLISAKLEGEGSVRAFYSKFPVTLKGGSREIQIADSYICITPEQYDSKESNSTDGEFWIENRGGRLTIVRPAQ
ncbi:MAG: hypothetical protein N3G76_00110 [Candidatus Micrarchaeota archaeon]|nr:hypothetical protein [Candidatus Micrarchaeota archaeon]